MIFESSKSFFTCSHPATLTRPLVPRYMLIVLAMTSRVGVFGSTFFVVGTGEAEDASESLRGCTSQTTSSNERCKRGDARSGAKGIELAYVSVLKKIVSEKNEKKKTVISYRLVIFGFAT